MNAIAHACEALYAQNGNPVTSLMAEDGIRALARALPGIVAEPDGLEARTAALYGAWLCGSCLGMVGMALHHKLCHVLGGSFGLPHAMAYNAAAASWAMARIATALGAADATMGLHDLAGRLGAPRALRDLGMPANPAATPSGSWTCL